jgi:hypothetical protein
VVQCAVCSVQCAVCSVQLCGQRLPEVEMHVSRTYTSRGIPGRSDGGAEVEQRHTGYVMGAIVAENVGCGCGQDGLLRSGASVQCLCGCGCLV